MDENQFTQNPGDYRTGSTKPPKTQRGYVAILLAVAIFVAGLFTAARLLEIPVFPMGEKAEENMIRFAMVEETTPEDKQAGRESYGLGITGQFLSEFDRFYYGLPEGVYITAVERGSDAARKGIVPGDILVAIDGIAVKNMEVLQNVLGAKTAGQTVELTIFRSGRQYRLNVSLS